MTRLDTAALHAWLNDELYDALDSRARHQTDRRFTEAAAAADRLHPLIAFDRWLRSHDGQQHPNDPATLTAGHPSLELRQAVSWLHEQQDAEDIEARAKTYAAIANELDRFTAAPDPFPGGPWAPTRTTWWDRLVALLRRLGW